MTSYLINNDFVKSASTLTSLTVTTITFREVTVSSCNTPKGTSDTMWRHCLQRNTSILTSLMVTILYYIVTSPSPAVIHRQGRHLITLTTVTWCDITVSSCRTLPLTSLTVNTITYCDVIVSSSIYTLPLTSFTVNTITYCDVTVSSINTLPLTSLTVTTITNCDVTVSSRYTSTSTSLNYGHYYHLLWRHCLHQ